ncbi:MAG: hypothetical protein EZS28_026989 [Streblomastix strix]|uniref:Uncharacterized protein n=1 Tax=Streblomastix strix TaxID=222440 RepID=A0A5J4V5Y8_9EUKA|nr:MAG: hypothetical protein EZS28_026989 [Streblomastix strix]
MKRVAKFSTIDDMKVVQNIRATFEGIMNKLFEEISWSGANVIFSVAKVEPALPEEKRALARSTRDSAVAVNQGVATGPNFELVDAALGGRDHRSVQLSNIEDYSRAGPGFGPEDGANKLRDEKSQQDQQQ